MRFPYYVTLPLDVIGAFHELGYTQLVPGGRKIQVNFKQQFKTTPLMDVTNTHHHISLNRPHHLLQTTPNTQPNFGHHAQVNAVKSFQTKHLSMNLLNQFTATLQPSPSTYEVNIESHSNQNAEDIHHHQDTQNDSHNESDSESEIEIDLDGDMG
jgi:hypothetical protein